MPRQLVRLSEVRTPQLTNDSYTPAQIQNAEADSLTTEDYLQYILSQIRLIQGTQSWKEPPQQNLTAVAATMDQVQADMAEIANLAAQVASLTTMLAQVGTTYVTQEALAQTNAAIAAITAQLQNQAGFASAQLAALANQVGVLQQQAANYAQQLAGFVTPAGLQQAITQATQHDQPLTGAQNKLNRTFTAPSVFVQATLRVFLNGQRLKPGVNYDYIAAESTVGLGYNQVVLMPVQAAPTPRDTLTADYIPA